MPLPLHHKIEVWRRQLHPLHQLRRLSGFRQITRLVDREIWAKLYGLPHPVRLYALRNSSYLVNRRTPEPRLAALILAIIKTTKPGCFWDVGAHIGYYSWLVSATSAATRVLAIEPDPTNLAILRKTQTHAPQVDILGVGVSETDGRASFLADRVSGATGTLETDQMTFNQRNYGEAAESIEIQTRSLDSIAVEYGFPDFIKMDVEGHEAHAVAGAAQVLGRRPLIIVEIFEAISPTFTLLRDAGYQILAADSLTDRQAGDGNYLAIPNERLDLLDALRNAYQDQLQTAGLLSTTSS